MKISKSIRLFILVTLLTLSTLGASAWGTLAAGNSQAPLAPGNPVIDPAANDHTVPVTSTVSITYDEDLDPTTVNTQTFSVQAMQTGLLTETYSITGGEIMLTPNEPFKPGELVQVSATTGTLGLPSGEGPTKPTVWQFRAAVSGGTGVLVPHPTTPEFGGGSNNDNALGDLDNDGDLDVVIANAGTYLINEVWVNDGQANFTPHPTTPDFGSNISTDVALGDIDSDGDLDVIIANYNDHPETVWLNDGAGNLSPHPTTPEFGAGDSWNTALGDIDGDGDLDAVVSNAYQPQTVWLNDGAGNYSPHPITPSFGASHPNRYVVLGDIDADGDLDAVVAKRNDYPQTVWLNDGAGNFNLHPTTPSFGAGESLTIVLGDIDQDFDLDAIVGNRDNEPETVWLNDGSGNFSAHPTTPSFGADFTLSLDLGDLDADGDLDLAVGNGGDIPGEPETIWINDGNGNFSPNPMTPSIGTGRASAARFGDLDADGDVDLLVSNTGPQTVWLNQNQADLAITKSSNPIDTFLPGEPVTYTISFTNLGPQIATGVIITDVLPAEITDIDIYSSLQIIPTGTISFTWLVPDLAIGDTGIITVTGLISPDLTTEFLITNTVVITTSAADTDPGNNFSSVTNEINIAPVLSEFPDQEVDWGQAITITGTITDPGLLDTQTVEITWVAGVTDTLELAAHERQFTASHTYAWPGEYTVTVRVTDKDGAWDEKTFTVMVNGELIYLPLISK